MSRDFYGKNFLPFIGVVVDGEGTVGRVRVRVFGIHPFDSPDAKYTGPAGQSVSDGDLPWCVVAFPVDSTATHHNLKPGDWVHGYFVDGESCQQPVVVGKLQRFDGSTGNKFHGREGTSGSSNSGDMTIGSGIAGDDAPVKINKNTYYDNVPGDTNPERVFNVLTTYFHEEKGVELERAKRISAGIVTSLMHESGNSLKTTAVGDHGTAWGIAQWRGIRRRGLNQMCGTNSDSIVCQTNFILTELENRNHSVYSEGSKTSVLNRLLKTNSAYDAAWIWTYYYEIPANRKAKSEERASKAESVYKQLAPKYQRAAKSFSGV